MAVMMTDMGITMIIMAEMTPPDILVTGNFTVSYFLKPSQFVEINKKQTKFSVRFSVDDIDLGVRLICRKPRLPGIESAFSSNPISCMNR